MTRAIYIEWDEETQEFDHWNYVGNGYSDPIFKTVKITKSARYSSEVSEEMIERAEDWIKDQRPEGRIVIK